MTSAAHRLRRRAGVLSALAVLGSSLGAASVTAQPPVDTTLAHVGSFFVADNLAPGEPRQTPTSAEIVDLTSDGGLLVYTDGLANRLGFVDVGDPANPMPLGALEVDNGSPTSVAIHRDRWALLAVSTSASFTEPSGELLVVDLASRAVVRSIPLDGQPDSIAVSPNGGRYAAITVENERDEDLDDGLLPQLPAGTLQVLDLAGQPDRWSLRTVDLTGLAATAPDDPEPEYVDINDRDQAVVSLQENNHLVVVDLRGASVLTHFSAGTADVTDVDTMEEELGPQGNGLIELSGSLEGRRREPDTVAWIDHDTFATANEGDYEDADGVEGGSRGFTLFNVDGTVEYESGSTFEHAVVAAGHYPEGRSENKGSEPEGLEVAHWRGRTLLLVAAERANIVGVYDVTSGVPTLVQLLPTGIGPEGLKFTHGGLLAVTAEVDGADDGFAARPFITLFGIGASAYPHLVSGDDGAGLPIPWVAISGLAAEPDDAGTVWAVSDSFLAQAWLYRLDVSSSPARIVERIAIGGVEVEDAVGDFDLEGVAVRPDGGFWFASEGRTNAGSSRPNLLVRTDGAGTVLTSVPLPASLVAHATSSGLEGAAVAREDGREIVYTVFQRPWADDPANQVKVARYDIEADAWTFARYGLDPVESPAGGVVGLSEITLLPDGTFAIVERDNQLGQEARVKRVYGVDVASADFAPHGAPLPLLEKVLLRDVIGDLDAASISVPDKLEGLAVGADGSLYLATDNDGVDDNYGETLFLDLGDWQAAFGG